MRTIQDAEQLTYEGVPVPSPDPWSTQQRNLIRKLAHEIRSTLASAQICAEVLAADQSPPDGKRRRYATVLTQQTAHIAHLLDDFIAITDYETDVEPTATEIVDINAVVWEAVRCLNSLARQRSISVKLTPSAIPSIAAGSQMRLTQAVRGCLEYILRTIAEDTQIEVAVSHITTHTGRPAIAVCIKCEPSPERQANLHLLNDSAWETITLSAVDHIITAHQGYVEPLEAAHIGLQVVLPQAHTVGAKRLPVSGRWRARTGPENHSPHARALGL